MPYSFWQARKTCFCTRKFLSKVVSVILYHDIPFLACKHKHLMKIGAPSDKFGVHYHWLPIEFHGFNSRIDF